MQLRRDAVCGLIREEGLVPRFRYASLKNIGKGTRFSVLAITYNLQRPDHISGIDEGHLFRGKVASALRGYAGVDQNVLGAVATSNTSLPPK